MRRDIITLHSLLLIAIVFWSLSFTAIKLALEHMSWITLTLLRLLIALGLFAIYLVIVPPRFRLRREDIPIVALLGFLGFTGYHLFLNYGETDIGTTAGTSALVIASAPAFMAIFAAWRLKEKVTLLRISGIVIAFVGLAVMVLLSAPGSEFRVFLTIGAAFILPSAIFAALYSVLAKPYLKKYSPFQLTAYAVFFGTLFTIPFAIVDSSNMLSDLNSIQIEGLLPVLFLAIFPTFISYSFWFYGLRRMEASAIGAYIYLNTLMAVVAGIIILGETITIPAIIGGAMVIAGVYTVQRTQKFS